MKALLKFKLPEDSEEYRHANKAMDYYLAIEDFGRYLMMAADLDEPPNLETITEKFFDIVESHGIDNL